jgi:branched-chain amino acid transport system substrate-binding protein
MRRILTSVGAVVAATALLSTAGGVVPASAASSDRTVTIGVIAPIDAGLTSFGHGIRDSVQLAVSQANKAKAIPGWTIAVKVLDDSSDATKGTAAAATMVQDPTVAAVVGPYNSGVSQAMLPTLQQGGLALISPSNTLTSLTLGDDQAHPTRQYDNYFRLVGADAAQAQFLADQAKRLGLTSAAVVSETKAVSKGLADRFAAAFTQDGGKVTVQQTVPDGASASDFTSFLTATAPTKPALLFFGGEYNVAATLRTAATAAGLTAPLMGGDGMNDPAYITGAGAGAAGSYASGVGVPLAQIPGAKKFTAAYERAGFSSQPTDYGPYAYDATNAVIAVLKSQLDGKTKLPANLRARVIQGIQKTKRTGITGPIAFDRYGDIVGASFTLYQVKGTPPAWVEVARSAKSTSK